MATEQRSSDISSTAYKRWKRKRNSINL